MEMPSPRRIEFGGFERRLAAAESRPELMRSDGETLLRELDARLSASEIDVLSLDIFDTLLLRNDKPEAVRYFEIAERVAVEFSGDDQTLTPADVYLARYRGMEMSYRARPDLDTCREGHIDEVLRSQLAQLGLPATGLDRLKAIEVEYEGENVVANTVLLDLCRKMKARGGSVVLLSDMYLDGETIGRILEGAVDEPELFDAVVSSADTIYSKRSGHVFRLMQERLNKPASAFFHIGDSLVSDVIGPKRAGWRALHFPVSDAEMRRREAALQAFVTSMADDGLDVTRWAKV